MSTLSMTYLRQSSDVDGLKTRPDLRRASHRSECVVDKALPRAQRHGHRQCQCHGRHQCRDGRHHRAPAAPALRHVR